MKHGLALILILLCVAGVRSLTEKEEVQKLIYEKYGEIYMGEPFLTAKHSVTDLWFELAGTLTKNVWQGYLTGFYKK